MTQALPELALPDRLRLAQRPTPLHRLERMSEVLGREIWVKRDDLTGNGLSGNKVRKLEFILYEAQRQDADLLITCGGAQSNHARATALAGIRIGLPTHALLRGAAGSPPEGNLLILDLCGAQIRWCTPEEYLHRDEIMEEMAAAARTRGERPMIIPEGGSNALGALGYVLAMSELVLQMTEAGITFDTIVCAVGSGGTYAGLCAGATLTGFEGQIVGFNVCDTAAAFLPRVEEITTGIGDILGRPASIRGTGHTIIDGYVGPGYALSGDGDRKIIGELARREGLLLDPVYTAKAFHGLADRIAQQDPRIGDRVLFLHTGGVFGLFPQWRQLAPSLQQPAG